jgi:hypothetical protein
MVEYRPRVLRVVEGEIRPVGFYRPYPPGVVDRGGRYLGPSFETDKHEFGIVVEVDGHGRREAESGLSKSSARSG